MKKITTYIKEGLRINKNIKIRKEYTVCPDTKRQLQDILKERLKEDKDADLNDIDVSNIEDMSYLFSFVSSVKSPIKARNIKIDKWNVSNVNDMCGMFQGCKEFNTDLSVWDVSNVKIMSNMFYGCKEFNSDLSKWDVSNVKDTDGMFYDCTKFTSDLSEWDVKNVETMYGMFYDCTKFTSDLSKWDIRNVKNKARAFKNSGMKQLPAWY